jgi:hypothetical protein
MAYKGHALKLGANWIGGTTNYNWTNAAAVAAAVTAGSAYPQQVSIPKVQPSFKFTSLNVGKALSVLGFVGLSLGGGTTAELWEILWDDNGVIASGSVHRKIAVTNGRAIWRQIQCNAGADATIELEVLGMSADGIASPYVFTEAQAFPASVDDARFTLKGPAAGGAVVQLASLDFGCVTSLTIDSGWQISTESCVGNTYDQRINVASITPKITVVTQKTQLAAASGGVAPTGLAATHANSFLKLAKRLPKVAGFVADATAEHIRITADGVIVPTSGFSGSGNDDATSTFELTATFDGTNTPFVVNAASVLT